MMNDVQARADDRRVHLDEAGISGLLYPITVLDRANGKQQTIGTFTMSVSVPEHAKGTHMSRFIEVLEKNRGEITMRTMPRLLAAMRERLAVDGGKVEVEFPYFMEKAAPVSGARALMDYKCRLVGVADDAGEDFIFGVTVPVTSLCPCSREISDYGAHNQRGYLTIDVRTVGHVADPEHWVWAEELIEIAESAASCPVFPLLKRPDERHVTMRAYDSPVFVEDMVRNVAVAVREDRRIGWFRVHARNEESIHNHSAFASTEWRRATVNSAK